MGGVRPSPRPPGHGLLLSGGWLPGLPPAALDRGRRHRGLRRFGSRAWRRRGRDIPAGLPSSGRGALPRRRRALAPAAARALPRVFADGILTARSFAGRHGQHVDVEQELLAMSVASAAAGVTQGLPTGSTIACSSPTPATSKAEVQEALRGAPTLSDRARPGRRGDDAHRLRRPARRLKTWPARSRTTASRCTSRALSTRSPTASPSVSTAPASTAPSARPSTPRSVTKPRRPSGRHACRLVLSRRAPLPRGSPGHTNGSEPDLGPPARMPTGARPSNRERGIGRGRVRGRRARRRLSWPSASPTPTASCCC